MSPRLWTTVVATAVATAAAVECLHRLRHPVPSQRAEEPARAPPSEELILEQLARNYAFFGKDGMVKVRLQRVVVVGVGGVGSWTATMLVRSGVGKIRIIDFDQVSLLSLNRHAVATLADVGTPKVAALKSHLARIAPWVEVEAVNQLWTAEHAEELIFGGQFEPTYIVDCIDNIDTKVDLLAYCHEKGLPVVSSGGAACKSDPSRVNIADISKTEEDPLSRAVRIRLKKRGVVSSVPVVFSAEKPDPRKAQLLPVAEHEVEKGNVADLAAIHAFRVRILPVLGTIPGMFGLCLTTHVLTTVAGYPVEPVEGKNRYKIYDGMYQSLAGQQARLGHTDQRVPLALLDVNYVLEEVFRGKLPVSGYLTRLTLLRWRADEPISFQNVVVLTKEEQKSHEQRVLKGGERLEDVYAPEVLERVAKRFREEKFYSQFR